MNTQMVNELRNFHEFVGEKVNTGGAISPEDILDEWRSLHPADGALEEEVAAIQEALDDMAAGDAGRPFADSDREFRARHNVPPKA